MSVTIKTTYPEDSFMISNRDLKFSSFVDSWNSTEQKHIVQDYDYIALECLKRFLYPSMDR